MSEYFEMSIEEDNYYLPLKVKVRNHALRRIYGTFKRSIDMSIVKKILNSSKIFDAPSKSQFTIFNSDHTIMIVCEMHFIDGEMLLEVVTVVSKAITTLKYGIQFLKVFSKDEYQFTNEEV